MQEHFLSVCVMVLYATLDQISAKCHAALLQDCIYTFSHTHTNGRHGPRQSQHHKVHESGQSRGSLLYAANAWNIPDYIPVFKQMSNVTEELLNGSQPTLSL